MSFFKDFKEDLSQAVNELVPGEDAADAMEQDNDVVVVNTLEDELDVESELSKLDGLLEKVTKDANTPVEKAAPVQETKVETPVAEVKEEKEDLHIQEESKMSETTANETMTMPEETVAPVQPAAPVHTAPVQVSDEVSDEVSVITEGTSITGNMASTGSLDIRGNINGDVQCNGKLVVTGTINGNSNSAEFFADAAKVEGEVVSTGTVKIGLGSVIIGNITASSAVIAGAIKGDIDVQGPVVVDTSAVVMGNIKSRSVQINNGAVIEGFCSQCYADIDVESLFGENK
ncbi:polymer-forming cytoskeletal protein [Thermoguttaceae bacterium LCP21S3_D4]|nr:polymer-forming cytoskeletal protein [Lachnospiraceae bacterium]MDD6304078.1 polymer-forming cytoskeletal protein [Lachnospiraceae bacterium]HCJ75683.1 cell shape determination protein CcmA [Roseburia sp.]